MLSNLKGAITVIGQITVSWCNLWIVRVFRLATCHHQSSQARYLSYLSLPVAQFTGHLQPLLTLIMGLCYKQLRMTTAAATSGLLQRTFRSFFSFFFYGFTPNPLNGPLLLQVLELVDSLLETCPGIQPLYSQRFRLLKGESGSWTQKELGNGIKLLYLEL